MGSAALLVCALATATTPLDRPFELTWFAATPTYVALIEAAAAPDPSVPDVMVTKAEVDAFLERVRVTDKELSWVEKYASPLSPRRQRKRVRSVRSVLLSDSRVALGRRFAERHAEVLNKVSAQYDVSVADLVSMMNAESRFGEVQGTFVVGAVFVANMAYLPGAERAAAARGDYDQPGAVSRKKNAMRVKARVDYAVENLATLLKYAKRRGADPMSFKGSWAGAIGITQFMPASLRWAADGDADGAIDLSTVPDAVASTASYLVAHGYAKGSLSARKKAFSAYNPNSEYVRAIVDYAARFKPPARSR